MAAKTYAKHAVGLQWWDRSDQEYKCLDTLWTHESHWNPKAKNRTSTAFGIPQFLDQTWINYGYELRPKNPVTQVRAGLRYISARYGSPCRAWKHWQRYRWY